MSRLNLQLFNAFKRKFPVNGRLQQVSRRTFMKLCALVPLEFRPVANLLDKAMHSPLDVAVSLDRASFRLGDETVWVLDTHRFMGRPRLEVERTESRIKVELVNALLPGTDMPADMTCTLRRTSSGWRMHLRLKLFSFETDVHFERWLSGLENAEYNFSASRVAGKFGQSIIVSRSGKINACFLPNWTLELTGNHLLSSKTLKVSLPTKHLFLSIPEPEDSSLFANKPKKRTALTLMRGKQDWQLSSLLPAPTPSTFSSATDTFDVLTVEVGKGECVIHAQSMSNVPSMRIYPGSALLGLDGTPFELPLRNVEIAAAIDQNPRETMVIARYDEASAWLKGDGCMIELGDDESPPFMLLMHGNTIQHMQCEPTLRSVSAAIADALTGPMVPPKGTLLAFNGGAAATRTVTNQRSPEIISKQQMRKRPVQTRQLKSEKRIRSQTKSPPQRLTKPGTVVVSNLTVPVIRAEDFLALQFELVNLKLESRGVRRQLVRQEQRRRAHIIVHFPPQNIHEEALFENEKSTGTVKPPPMESRIAGESRLVFEVPQNISAIPFTLKSLLDACGKYPLKVPSIALPPPPPRPSKGLLERSPRKAMPVHGSGRRTLINKATAVREIARQGPDKDNPPSGMETVIEMPYRLLISPHEDAAWAHANTPVVGHRKRVELWHTRLAVRDKKDRIDERNDYHRTLRAVWSPDYNPKNIPEPGTGPFLSSLDGRDRHELCALMSDFTIPGYTPLPVWANHMMLTSLGAWLDCRGVWEPPCDPKAAKKTGRTRQITQVGRSSMDRVLSLKDPCDPGTTEPCQGEMLTIEEWRHRATMGRDHYVRVVYKGYLFPFGHRASLVKVTERKFRAVKERGALSGRMAACLIQSMFIVVREPLLTYPITNPEDRRNPFRSIRITTTVTPKLDKPAGLTVSPGASRRAFWPSIGGRPFNFHMIAEDWRGQRTDFTAPVIFLDQGWAKDRDRVEKANSEYIQEPHLKRRQREWGGKSVAFAEVQENSSVATTLNTESITFGARRLECLVGDLPLFLPEMVAAQVRIPAVEALTGGQTSTVKIADTYVDHGFVGKNAGGEIFAEIVGATPLTFSADRSGGVATPNINIAGLSRKNGPVGAAPANGSGSASGLDEFAKGEFHPEKFFAGAAAEAMLLGGINLFDLFAPKLSSADAPKMVNTPIYKGDKLVAVETVMTWEPPVNPRTDLFVADQNGKTSFRLDSRIVNPLDGGEPESSISGIITNFSIALLGGAASFIEVEFESFEFSSESGSKMDVAPLIRDVRFKGVLKYVNELAEYLKSTGMMGDTGLSVDVNPTGVTAGLDIAIPAVNTGVMTLQNIAFNMGFTIPFSGDPMRMRFAFCEKSNPFLLTVYGLGGGGYVSLALGLDGVEQLEMAFEFAACVALDIGVASGGVEIAAGIYIAIEENDAVLSGYLRIAGEVTVLALVRISIEFNMALGYDFGRNIVWGECILTVEVELLCFSVPVTLKVRREFSDRTSLPFRAMMSADDWTSYCEAFA